MKYDMILNVLKSDSSTF